MPWDTTPTAGFSNATPWLPLNPDHVLRNVASERRDPGSMLALYGQLIALRRTRPVLQTGRYSNASAEADVFVFERRLAAERLLIMLNFSPDSRAVRLSPQWRVVLSTGLDRVGGVPEGALTLRGWEGVILEGAEAALPTSSSETAITDRT